MPAWRSFSLRAAKTGQILLLVIEDLDDLLAGYHLLNIGVQFAQAVLLLGVVDPAVFGAEINIPEHRRIAQHNEQREPPVEHKEHDQRTGHLDKGLDDQGKAVVQGRPTRCPRRW